jgi:hypothetical protein
MNTRATFGTLAFAALMLAACGSADDASTEATADTVEMPADEALEAISDEPAADPDALALARSLFSGTSQVDAADGTSTDDAAEPIADAAARHLGMSPEQRDRALQLLTLEV